MQIDIQARDFSLTAGVSMALNLPHPGLLLTLGGYFGLLFLTAKFRDRALGLAFVFALTGFMGYEAVRGFRFGA